MSDSSKRMRILRQLTLITVSLLWTQNSFALNCSEVRQLTGLYFNMHFKFKNFDNQLSARTLDKLFKTWDSTKLYFYQTDIDEFKKKYSASLGERVGVDGNCTPIDEISARYAQRFDERMKYAQKLIAETPNFGVDEYLTLDRKDMPYAKSQEDLNERWRQQIKFALLNLKTTTGSLDKARVKIKKRHELLIKHQKEETKDAIYSDFLNAFSLALDPHSSYMPAEEFEDFRIDTGLSLEGIGATLQSEDGFTKVFGLTKGGAADKGGALKLNDKILAVAQGDEEPVDVVEMELPDVVRKIRGPRGTVVKLSILREEAKQTRRLVVPIVRDRIQIVEQQASSRVIDVDTKDKSAVKHLKIGLLTLPTFYIDFEGREKHLKEYRSASRDTREQLRLLKAAKVDAVVLDLRNNGGGGLDESITTAGLFIGPNPVVQVKKSDRHIESYSDDDAKIFYDGPLLVMINRNSASASEIFAGAIQDYDRGLIVGDKQTYGKGTVQQVVDLAAKLGAIKVTESQFYRASGASTQMKGVTSDIVLPDLYDEMEIGERYADYALPYEGIKAAKYHPMGLSTPYAAALRKRSDQRVAVDKEMVKVRAEIDKFRKNKNERVRVSLKETDSSIKAQKAEEAEDKRDAARGYRLKDDFNLQEVVKIAADYAQLLKKKTLGESEPIVNLIEARDKTKS